MKKTFKKSIACLLAVLMVVFSVPFTALAAGEVDGYLYGPSEVGSNHLKIWWDEADPPKAEPDYITHNDDRVSDLGGWGLSFGDKLDVTQAAGGDQKEELMDEYRPIFAVTASAYDSFKSTTTYGLADKVAYSDADILDASDIKAGQKFVVTFEFGGFDSIATCQVKGTFDSSKIKLGYWGGRGNSTWTTATQANSTTSIIADGGTNFYSAAGNSAGTTCSVDDSSFYGVFTTRHTNCSSYVADRPYGEYGLVIFSLAFEAVEDCDLREVFEFAKGETGTYVCCYNPENQLFYTRPQYKNGQQANYGFAHEDDYYNGNIYGYLAPVIYSGVTGGSEPVEHVHDFAGAVAVSNGDGTHTLTCTAAGCDQSEGYQKIVDCSYTSEVTKQPTCTEAGVTTWTCTECNHSYTTDEPAATGHTADYADVQYNWTGSDAEGYTACAAVIGCANCDGTYGTVSATISTSSSEATCTVPGKVTYTATFDDENLQTQVKEVSGVLAPHTYTTQASDQLATPATCTEAAKYYAKCDVCGAVSDTETVAVGEPLGHEFTVDSGEMVSAATCQQKQLNKAKCSRCDAVSEDITVEVGELAEHTPVLDEDSAVEPTFDAPGKEADTVCSVCGTLIKEGAAIPAIPYYTITATAENGKATANGEASVKVAVNGDVTLVATANEGYTFVGWSLNDKIVSTEETYATKAIANADYVAIYELAEAEAQFTVVFTDQYGNVYSTQTVSAGTEVVPPADPTLAGFTFAGWSLTEEEIDALTTNATIVANFERAADQYVVTVTGDCTIAGADAQTTTVDYNTKVTVNAPEGSVNGTWKVDGAAVAYGTSYTFLVGADITLTYEEDAAVTAEPTVAAVSTDRDANSHKVAFLATRSLADGYEYVTAGFVYGKNLTEDDLKLANVGEQGTGADSGVVKVGYCSTDSEQFRLSYGLKAMSGTVSAKAFLAYVDTNGETQIIYGALQTYTY